ncbi:hypothetical protein N1851_011109 [Merluccius polli]|uniref:Uncharacterized protein n=1 Tax=Merluccius polli TaxID=89951 RepID=A0AA47P6N6_MERPO|nr:hypothetical protein N1851_011109 [Merluccius polli]
MKCVFSGKDVTKALVVLLLRCLPLFGMCEAAEEGLGSIPTLGSIIAASLSFLTVYTFSSSALDSLSVDAEHVQMKALNIQSARELSIEDKMTAAAELDSTFGTPECRVQLRCCTTSPPTGCLNELH